ncbi:lipase [Bacillus cereus]|nr:lipase [Bacillus cereus]
MNNEMEQNKELHVASDWGKLELAGQDIYTFNRGEYPYNKSEEKNEKRLKENFNAEIVDREVDKNTGFAAYAFKDKTTGEIVISYMTIWIETEMHCQ